MYFFFSNQMGNSINDAEKNLIKFVDVSVFSLKCFFYSLFCLAIRCYENTNSIFCRNPIYMAKKFVSTKSPEIDVISNESPHFLQTKWKKQPDFDCRYLCRLTSNSVDQIQTQKKVFSLSIGNNKKNVIHLFSLRNKRFENIFRLTKRDITFHISAFIQVDCVLSTTD